MRNRSLAELLAKSSLIPVVLAVSLFSVSSASAAEPVYKWKDSNGESHYSQQAPDGVKYETISTTGAPLTESGAASGHADSAVTASKPNTPQASNGQTPGQVERQKLCDTASKNVDALTTHPLVDMDINGTGTPVRLTPEQQTEQLEIAKKQAAAYCVK